ncbi:hypothetical protein [Microscilla marina]|uniref:Uncharacterized protein n=1 Tax=Microscilla marina ATCC 23134 TaxID=313606 RepID=A1ZZA7_MICM2|nr:hypothetical protein [Microscilla marina]EAY24259.1 hypothetical protein M23134_03645 [Microscilla marina ATCC 23134]
MMKKQIQVFFTLVLLTGLVNTAYSQVSKEQLNEVFEAQKTLIEGSDRDCYPVNTVVGDLNGDGKPEGVVQYNCGFKGSMGNASAGMGWAILINRGGKLTVIINQTNVNNTIPLAIENGTIKAQKMKYKKEDARCCPSIKIAKKYKLIGNQLKEVK